MVIKNPPKISPGLIFGGGADYRDDICVKNQGGLFSGGGLIFGGGRAYYRDFTVCNLSIIDEIKRGVPIPVDFLDDASFSFAKYQ